MSAKPLLHATPAQRERFAPVKFGGPFDLDAICFQMPDKRRFANVRAMLRTISWMAWALTGAALAVGTILGFAIHG